jgi:hypothetical protein
MSRLLHTGCLALAASLMFTLSWAGSAFAAGVTAPGLPPVTLNSPNRIVRAEIGIEASGRLWYQVSRDTTPPGTWAPGTAASGVSTMIEPSPLGVIVDGVDLGTAIIGAYVTDPVEHQETYSTRGAHRVAVNHYYETTVALWRHGAGDSLFFVVVRVYDDGVAYRYVMPAGPQPRTIGGEASAWRIPAGAVCWAHTSTTNYESYLRPIALGSLDADLGGPLTCELPSAAGFVLISEGALREYSGMTYDLDAGSVKQAGAVGVKIDDIFGDDSDAIAKVRMQEAILRDAAERRLMINLHGVNKSTGLSRTWPNEITREGFMGSEPNGLWWQGLYVPPIHNAALPFVRMVAGPGDYGPLLVDRLKRGPTTLAHQLATVGLFHSPFVPFADDPALLRANRVVYDLIRMLPTDWEETVVLEPSAIGSVAALARRRGSRWYIFAVEGFGQTRPITLDLSFLGTRQYDAVLIRDETADTVSRTFQSGVDADDTLETTLLPGGGFVAVLSLAADPARPVRQGFTSLPPSNADQGRLAVYSLIRDHADLVAHSYQDGVPWPEALVSSDASTYPPHLRQQWTRDRALDAALAPDHAKYLMLNPIDTATYAQLAQYWGEWPHLPLPWPWGTYEFNHPNVKTAFLNYAIAAIEFHQPRYVAIGIESNILLAHAPHRWMAYRELNAYVYSELKQRYPNLFVFTTIHYEHMSGMTAEGAALSLGMRDAYPDVLTSEVAALLAHSDLLALSSYPYMIAGNPYQNVDGTLDPDYFERAYEVARTANRRLAIDQTGYVSRYVYLDYLGASLAGSEPWQDAYVRLVLGDAHARDFEFVVNFVGWDYGEAYGTFPTSLTWAWTGLVREDGSAKPALGSWDAFRQP